MPRNVIRRARDASQQYRVAEKRLADATVLHDDNLLELAAAVFVARNAYLRAMGAFQN
jgi:hypothetical protein